MPFEKRSNIWCSQFARWWNRIDVVVWRHANASLALIVIRQYDFDAAIELAAATAWKKHTSRRIANSRECRAIASKQADHQQSQFSHLAKAIFTIQSVRQKVDAHRSCEVLVAK